MNPIPVLPRFRAGLIFGLSLLFVGPALAQGTGKAGSPYAEIRVRDAETDRGVPLIELVTVHNVRFVTDNAGRIALNEPDLMGQEVFFRVQGHGYDVKKDGFGIAGVRLVPKAGETLEVKVTRRNVAERLARLTGQGRYRDSRLLGREVPAESRTPGKVAGQDSVQPVVFRNHAYWFWGDTSQLKYPLGLFRMAGARTPLPTPAEDFTNGLAYEYFVGKDGFARAMMPLPEHPEGVLWLDGFCAVPDDAGIERLVAHYSRRKGLTDELEHGLALFDEGEEIFKPVKVLPMKEKWRFVHGHPEAVTTNDGTKYLYCGLPMLNVRVPATLKDVLDPAQYEAFTASEKSPTEWTWQKKRPPTDSPTEAARVKAGTLSPEQARFHPANADDATERIVLHSGTVRWNAHRRRWVMLAGQIGGKPSFLGEVWYAEAKEPTGPFTKAVRVLTHDRKTFYNVCHHPFMDRDGGRVIHFEGTYTHEFSGNPDPTPRYDYNQILYRLDLDAPALRAVRVP